MDGWTARVAPGVDRSRRVRRRIFAILRPRRARHRPPAESARRAAARLRGAYVVLEARRAVRQALRHARAAVARRVHPSRLRHHADCAYLDRRGTLAKYAHPGCGDFADCGRAERHATAAISARPKDSRAAARRCLIPDPTRYNVCPGERAI